MGTTRLVSTAKHPQFYELESDVPASKNMVSRTTESKYVVVSAIPVGEGSCTAAKAKRAMDEK